MSLTRPESQKIKRSYVTAIQGQERAISPISNSNMLASKMFVATTVL